MKKKAVLTILLDSLFDAVFADPRDLITVKLAARCLNVSVSVPPPAVSNSCLRTTIEVCVFPEPLAPETMIAWG